MRKIYQCEICQAEYTPEEAKGVLFRCPRDGGRLKPFLDTKGEVETLVSRGKNLVLEVIPPRNNQTDALAVENILASLTLAPSPFSLEIAGTENGRGFLIRGEEGMVKHIASEIQAAYGQAECVPLDGKDPARIAPGEIVAQGLHDDGIVLIAVTSQQPGSQVKRTGLV